MPARFRLVLEPKVLHPLGPPQHTGPGLHAAVLAALSQVDPAGAAWLHSPAARPKPFALTPLLEQAGHGHPRFAFEVGVLHDPMRADFAKALAALDILRIGHSSFLPLELVTLVDESYEAFYARARPSIRWGLRFLTPTTVRTGSATGVHLGQPLPTVEVVFGSLARRWTHFSGIAPLADRLPQVFGEHLHVVSHEIRTAEYVATLRQPPMTGFIGSVEFALLDATRVEDDAARDVSALVSFAAVAGVGDLTTKGMGVVVPFPVAGPRRAQAPPTGGSRARVSNDLR
ncbi:MAG: CRISPR system precrRNA processing endoribonuclease RAMP protein Cas6 [Acidimicrobiales bacterium]